jgi:acetyl esterase/lipase
LTRVRGATLWLRLRRMLLFAFVGATLPACTAIYFTVANVPASLTAVTRIAAIAYSGGVRGKLDIYRPPDHTSATARPVIVFFYGGGWTSGARQQYRFAATTLAQLGYVTVVPDYRLYPEVRFPAFVEDGARAVAWVQAHIADYGGDASRIVLMGHSAGAHLAALLAIDSHYLRAAGADPARIAGLIALSGPYDLNPNTAALNTIFAAPYTPDDWRPTHRVDRREAPALLLVGADDRLVGSAASKLFAELLGARGGEVELKLYDHCDHTCPVAALAAPARRKAPTRADVAAFMARISARRPN